MGQKKEILKKIVPKFLQKTNHKKEISDNAKNAALEVKKVALETIGQKKEVLKKIVPKRGNATVVLTQKPLSS